MDKITSTRFFTLNLITEDELDFITQGLEHILKNYSKEDIEYKEIRRLLNFINEAHPQKKIVHEQVSPKEFAKRILEPRNISEEVATFK